ncbi:Satratoxin biosynthesis SC1 cluster protein 4 [Colletotrichum fructicola Nara gc5]|uniref:Satratoxin biosynthesis SC1 cluster protein 4 n=2 Tax=Colletotrichum fructicola (strain Nara gc5) TaxID=1213859 RepID=A0A7J6ITH2_COLFN|nr:Satratoxin biosynthesis SC1 cluster protein 4 [Colletotrichum fructicola]KAF4479323.1 Satratoxin biosynthesis SC1 cluster protein 4 [Colletotrichum fructicola Nara gc5]KAF4893974.1 Satratoxin biosynthesis SC1 cluster protein 4 [Colletotrichum fructicola]KAF4939022.1 Satratoxin biosynthesis SC1 cluster protein 4 [Colletotrichum fructicola]
MRSTRIITWLLPFLGVVATQASSIETVPTCAQPCIAEGLNRTACPTSNQTCLCQDPNYIDFVEDCVLNHCLPIDALATQNYTWYECGFSVENDFTSTVVPRLVMFFVLPTLSIITRMVVKFSRVSVWGADDLMIVATFCFLIAFVPLNANAGKNGAGQDMWSLTVDQITEYFKASGCFPVHDAISNTNQNFYITQALYYSTIAFLKASILFMYLRIFPGERFRVVLWGTQAFNLAIGVTFLLLGIFQCRPIHLAWTAWRRDSESLGTCMDVVIIAMVYSAIQVGLDIWMLILPLAQILGLNMKWSKKFGLMFMFSLGLFLTAASTIRLKHLVDYHQGTHNFTVGSLQIAIWSDIELCVGVFTACIPTTRQFFRVFIFGRPDGSASLHSEHIHARSLEGSPKRSTRQAAEAVDEPSPHTP